MTWAGGRAARGRGAGEAEGSSWTTEQSGRAHREGEHTFRHFDAACTLYTANFKIASSSGGSTYVFRLISLRRIKQRVICQLLDSNQLVHESTWTMAPGAKPVGIVGFEVDVGRRHSMAWLYFRASVPFLCDRAVTLPLESPQRQRHRQAATDTAFLWRGRPRYFRAASACHSFPARLLCRRPVFASAAPWI